MGPSSLGMEIYSRQGEKGGQVVKISRIWSQFLENDPSLEAWIGYLGLCLSGQNWVTWAPRAARESGRLSVLFSPISMVLFLLLKIGIELIYIVVLVSSVQQSESALYIYIHLHIYLSDLFFEDSFPIQVITEHWIEFPVLYNRSLLSVICFIYSSVHLLIPVSKFIHPPSFPLSIPPVTIVFN